MSTGYRAFQGTVAEVPSPPPKDARARRRYNAPAGGEWLDLFLVTKPVLEELPARFGAGDWSRWASEVWESWRQDPASTQWTPADVHYALDTLSLVDACAGKPRPAFAAEIRLRMDGLGLTPKGKRNLRWRVVLAGEPVEHPAPVRDRSRDGQRRLRTVDTTSNGGKPE